MNNAVKNVRKVKFDQRVEKYSIIIPSAGAGTRLKNQEPKSLIKLNNQETVISRQIRLINEAMPNNEIILVVGHEADYVMDNTPKNLIKIENEGYETNNVARSIGIGLRAATTDKVIIILGDVVFNLACLSPRFANDSFIVLDNNNLMKETEVGCYFDNKTKVVDNLMIGLPNKWAQIAYLTGQCLEFFKKIVFKKENGKLYAFECLNKMVEMGGRLLVCDNLGASASDIDIFSDLEIVRSIK